MKKVVSFFLSISIVTATFCGCNSRPDPKANPNFNTESYNDPGALKMEPLNPEKKK